MDKNEILARLQEIFRDVLENDRIVLSPDTTAADIDEWDSLSHVQLIVEIEKEFKIRFTSKEILSWSKVGDIVDRIG